MNADALATRRLTEYNDQLAAQKLDYVEPMEIRVGMSYYEAEAKGYLSALPPVEQDILKLYYIDGITQVVIGKMLQLTQGDISSRLRRACVRIRWMASEKAKSIPDGSTKLNKNGVSDRQITDLMRQGIICQTQIGEKLGLSQSQVHYRLVRMGMIGHGPDKWKQHDFYMRHEVELPRFQYKKIGPTILKNYDNKAGTRPQFEAR